MGKRTIALASILVTTSLAGVAQAEDETHDGFFLRLGLNFGPLIGSLEPEVGVGEADYSGLTIGSDLLLGGTLADGFVLGGALITGSTSDPTIKVGDLEGEGDGNLILAGLGVFANYYFDPTQGGHLQAILGFAAVDFVSSSGTSGGNDPTGVMLGFGGGYDFWIGGEWSIGPFARVLYAPTSADGYKFTYLYPSIGVVFTYH